MSTESTTNELPEVAPVSAVRLSPNEMPNRSQRATIYTELGSLNLPEGKIRCWAHRQAGSLLFMMPDRSGFSLDTAQVGLQCYQYWKQTSLVDEATLGQLTGESDLTPTGAL